MILVVVGGFVGYRLGRLHFDHSTIENEIKAVGDMALTARKMDVRQEVVDRLRFYDIEIDPEDISVKMSRASRRITIAFSYSRPANFLVLERWFPFDIDVQRQGGKAVGLLDAVTGQVEESYNSSARKYQKSVKDAFKK